MIKPLILMKKLITTLLIFTTISAAFAVEYKFSDWQKAARTSFEAELDYLNSVDSGDTKAALNQKIGCLLRPIHIKDYPKDKAIACAEQAKALFYANIDNGAMRDLDIMSNAMRFGDWPLAAQAYSRCKIGKPAVFVIDNALKLYKNNAISKDVAIEDMIKASLVPVNRDWQYAHLIRLLNNIPTVDKDGKPFMTVEQRKDFYGNFLLVNKVSKQNAEFMGICKTEYQLVK